MFNYNYNIKSSLINFLNEVYTELTDKVFYLKIILLFWYYVINQIKNYVYKTITILIYFFFIICYLVSVNLQDNLGFLVFAEFTALFLYILISINFYQQNTKSRLRLFPVIMFLVFSATPYPTNLQDLLYVNFTSASKTHTTHTPLFGLFIFMFELNSYLVLLLICLFLSMFVTVAFSHEHYLSTSIKDFFIKDLNLIKSTQFVANLNLFKKMFNLLNILYKGSKLNNYFYSQINIHSFLNSNKIIFYSKKNVVISIFIKTNSLKKKYIKVAQSTIVSKQILLIVLLALWVLL